MKPLKLLIIDYSVLIYNITANLENLDLPIKFQYLQSAYPEHYAGKTVQDIAQEYIKAQWVYHFYRGPDYVGLQEFIPVIVKDSKPYWRSLFYPDYKGNRQPKTETFFSIKSVGERLAKALNIPIFEEFNYEADDIAASFVKFHNLAKSSIDRSPEIEQWANLKIMLWTVDSDWHQLVSETTTWYNTGPWAPLVRGPKEAREWAKRRLKVDLAHPQDIVAVKCIKGDKSDNLPPGTKPYFIDLFNTHPDYRLLSRPQYNQKLLDVLKAPVNNTKALKGAQSILSRFTV